MISFIIVVSTLLFTGLQQLLVHRTSHHTESFTCMNELPNDVQSAKTFIEFKEKLKSFIVTSRPEHYL